MTPLQRGSYEEAEFDGLPYRPQSRCTEGQAFAKRTQVSTLFPSSCGDFSHSCRNCRPQTSQAQFLANLRPTLKKLSLLPGHLARRWTLSLFANITIERNCVGCEGYAGFFQFREPVSLGGGLTWQRELCRARRQLPTSTCASRTRSTTKTNKALGYMVNFLPVTFASHHQP